jgi:hypothetical protein
MAAAADAVAAVTGDEAVAAVAAAVPAAAGVGVGGNAAPEEGEDPVGRE